MIGHPVYGNGDGPLIFCNTNHVRINSIRNIPGDQRFPVLCGKDDMSKVGMQGLWHEFVVYFPRPYRTQSLKLQLSQD